MKNNGRREKTTYHVLSLDSWPRKKNNEEKTLPSYQAVKVIESGQKFRLSSKRRSQLLTQAAIIGRGGTTVPAFTKSHREKMERKPVTIEKRREKSFQLLPGAFIMGKFSAVITTRPNRKRRRKKRKNSAYV